MPRKTPDDLRAEERVRAHLRQQINERGIDKAELARRIGYDDGNLSRLLKGTRGSVRLGTVLRICAALGLNPTRLLQEDPPAQFFLEGSENHDGPAVK